MSTVSRDWEIYPKLEIDGSNAWFADSENLVCCRPADCCVADQYQMHQADCQAYEAGLQEIPEILGVSHQVRSLQRLCEALRDIESERQTPRVAHIMKHLPSYNKLLGDLLHDLKFIQKFRKLHDRPPVEPLVNLSVFANTLNVLVRALDNLDERIQSVFFLDEPAQYISPLESLTVFLKLVRIAETSGQSRKHQADSQASIQQHITEILHVANSTKNLQDCAKH